MAWTEGQQQGWEGAVRRTAAEEEARIARLEAQTAAASMVKETDGLATPSVICTTCGHTRRLV